MQLELVVGVDRALVQMVLDIRLVTTLIRARALLALAAHRVRVSEDSDPGLIAKSYVLQGTL